MIRLGQIWGLQDLMVLRTSSMWEQRLQQQARWPGRAHLEHTFPVLCDVQHASLE